MEVDMVYIDPYHPMLAMVKDAREIRRIAAAKRANRWLMIPRPGQRKQVFGNVWREGHTEFSKRAKRRLRHTYPKGTHAT